jgi:DNA-binding beta-propeller fold protein YncE
MYRRVVLLGLTCTLLGPTLLAGQGTEPGYRIAVVSESGDIVTWIRPGPGTLTEERVVPVGSQPSEIDGPHNVTVSPDGRYYYVTIAHGTPYGSLWKLTTVGDTLLGRAPLELFPTTIALTPDGGMAFVANSDFHGFHPRENVISVIHTPSMTNITDIPACDMPHGMKVNHAGTRAYASCMHSDELLEIDAATLSITRRARTGSAGSMAGMSDMVGGHAGHPDPSAAFDGECQPTFVSVSPDDRTLYAACNHSGTLQVWDAAALTMTKEIPVGAGAYNVEPSRDGSLVIVTNKKAQSVSLVDTRSLLEIARIPVTKKIVHGVAYSPDDKYAFISQESVGADPGAVDMIDLAARKVVATIPVRAQPTGITVLVR